MCATDCNWEKDQFLVQTNQMCHLLNDNPASCVLKIETYTTGFPQFCNSSSQCSLFKGNKLLTHINFTGPKIFPHGDFSTVENQRQGRVVQYVDQGRELSRSLTEPKNKWHTRHKRRLIESLFRDRSKIETTRISNS